ncbi:hypothetical protein SAMN04515617_101143 [Collimonas sp. OK242]|uniref:hypothetical protein n=1 Tax=Collimonas sp. OK242 TaxID=1798195 RepID=UPI00089AB8EB|nr:hypothetical protein [Collimonas sp. OK242]SDX09612.1 hypothetical protein SAMN04515617_101143 [Collimonas sp. OK242]
MGIEWFNGWARRYAVTPEKLAKNELNDARLSLFQSERQLLEAGMRVDYHRSILVFLETISTEGVENFANKQRPQQPSSAQQVPLVLHQILQEEPGDTRRTMRAGKVSYE